MELAWYPLTLVFNFFTIRYAALLLSNSIILLALYMMVVFGLLVQYFMNSMSTSWVSYLEDVALMLNLLSVKRVELYVVNRPTSV